MNVFSSFQSRYALFPLFLVGLTFILLAPVFWIGTELPEARQIARAPENAQLYERVYPALLYGFGRLREGDLPLWNPNQHCGVPFLADPIHGVFQPLNAVFLFLDTQRAMAVHAFLCLFLMGTFFAVYARSLNVRYLPAIAGGIAYAFSGASASAMSRPELANSLVWTPLLFWAIREYTRSFHRGTAVIGGLAGALLILSGSWVMCFAMLTLAVPYALFRVAGTRGDPKGGFGAGLRGFAVMAGLAVALSAVQWVPSLTWLASLESPARALLRFDAAGTVPASLSGIVAHALSCEPDVLPRIGYTGIAVLLLLPAALLHRAARREAFFFTLAAAALLCAAVLGKTAWPGGLPSEALMFPAIFALSVLAALGLHRLLTTGRDARSPLIWAPAVLVLGMACLLFYAAPVQVRGRILLLVAAILPFLILRLRWVAFLSGLAVASLLYFDLSIAGVSYYEHPYRNAHAFREAYAQALMDAEEQALGDRILLAGRPAQEPLPANLPMLTPLRGAGGAAIPLSWRAARWWAALGRAEDGTSLSLPETSSAALLNYMAARVLLVAPESKWGPGESAEGALRLRAARNVDGLKLYVNDAALPRLRWVPNCRVVEDLDEAIRVLCDPEFDGSETCLVERGRGLDLSFEGSGPGSSPEIKGETPSCVFLREAPEAIEASVDAPGPGVAVLADTFTGGWRVYVNGEPAPMLCVNGLFRGVAVAQGESHLLFVHSPRAPWVGLLISVAAFLLLLFQSALPLLRRT